MANGKIPGVRNVSKKEASELLKLPWTHDEALSTDTWEARILADGCVLLYWPVLADGTLCPSREAAKEMKRGYDETKREAIEQFRTGFPDPCLTLLPPVDDFIRDVEVHAKSLGPRLRIPADVLDYTPSSLDAVDKALKRIPWAKRQVPDLVTPLVAYLGEVIRRGCGGQWTKIPATTREREVSVYDPVELAAYDATRQRVSQAAVAAAQKAADEARARRASAAEVSRALQAAHGAVYQEIWTLGLKPIGTDVIKETINDHENEPMIAASRGRLFQPFASVFIPMIEPSKRVPLRSSYGVPYDRPGIKPKPVA
jgi:hypothetical protein